MPRYINIETLKEINERYGVEPDYIVEYETEIKIHSISRQTIDSTYGIPHCDCGCRYHKAYKMDKE